MCAFFFKNVTKDNIYQLLFNNCLLGVVTSGGWYSTVGSNGARSGHYGGNRISTVGSHSVVSFLFFIFLFRGTLY
jgi:hypothetical protein